MAALLGDTKQSAAYRDASAQKAGLIESQLWNDADGLWLCRDWNGTWNHRASSCCFYPMVLPQADAAHVRRAIADHLLNPRRFGGKYLLPVTPRDDPAYPEQYYTRGRIWPGQAVLVHWALREQGQEDAAAELARGCLATAHDEWLNEGHLHENYHAETADGDDTPESGTIYSYGMMLPLIAWNHLRDQCIDGREVTAPPETFADFLDRDGTLLHKIDPRETLPPLE